MLRELNPVAGARLDTETPGDEWFVCRRCATPVARAADAISVEGAHLHVNANPEGVIYRIRCFATAACRVCGGPQTFWSWFAGTSWEVALCNGCQSHLGWRFQGREQVFFGLIEEALVRRRV